MFKNLFGSRPTTKGDVIFSIAGAVIAVWKAWDTYKAYEQETYKEISSEIA